jgi:hypothetical protein
MKEAETTVLCPKWSEIIPEEQWKTYVEAIRALNKANAQYVLGGAFGLAAYTGRWRNTKDLDFFILPEEKDCVIDALTKAGFDDYHSKHEYDRSWIYRATKDEMIVDAIWQTPNHRSSVDGEWLKRGRKVRLREHTLLAIPAEELLAIKLFVIQRDRCDWPDLINLLHAVCGELDWDHVLARLGDEEPLLGGILQVFNWVSPERARQIPQRIRERFHLKEATVDELGMPRERRVGLLDSRPWFAAMQPEDQPMRV